MKTKGHMRISRSGNNSNQYLNLTLTHVGCQQPAEGVPHAVRANEEGRQNAAVAGAGKRDKLQTGAHNKHNYSEHKDKRVEATLSVDSADSTGNWSGEPSESEYNHSSNGREARRNNQDHQKTPAGLHAGVASVILFETVLFEPLRSIIAEID